MKALGDELDDELENSKIPDSFKVNLDELDTDKSVLPTGMQVPKVANIFDIVFDGSSSVVSRTRYEVFTSLTEEVGELATEVAIAEGYSRKPVGKDGVVGEAIDVIVCALDMIFVDQET